MQFYKNRFWRIMPLYWIWTIVHLVVIGIQRNVIPSFLDIFGIFTTLSYYGIGSIRSNWYLSAILLLYATYPILFSLIKRFKWVFLLLTVGLTFIIIYKTQLNWYHNVFIGRLYIFLLGIYFYQVINDCDHRHFFDFIAIVLISIAGIVSLFYNTHQFDYWGTCCLCPILIALLCLLPSKIINSKTVSFCGKHSLEIFIANCWTMLLMSAINSFTGSICKSIAYFISNVLFALALIYINKLITQSHTKSATKKGV